MQKNTLRFSRRRQQGATLIVALVVLLIIMMIGVTAVTTSKTQLTLAGNLQFEESAMNNAETALLAGEAWLAAGKNFEVAGFTTYNAASSPALNPIGRLAALTAPANKPWTMAWSDSNSVEVAAKQRYMIEKLSNKTRRIGASEGQGGRTSKGCDWVNVYAVTGRGVSERGSTRYAQSIYSVSSC